ncbi:MAG: hypothetical protein WAU15_02575 [Nitrosomonas sp.]
MIVCDFFFESSGIQIILTRLLINDKVDIRVANNNLKSFPPLSSYLGKSLAIRGWVSRNNDYYTLLIHHPSSLIVR